MPVTLLLINASYGFVDSFRPLGSFAFDSGMMISIQHHLPAGFRVPIPGVMLEGFDAQKYDTSLGYPAFLWGTVYRGARWYYYPAALLCKTPVALMALMLAALVTLPIARRHLAPEDFASSWSMALGGIIFLAGVFIIGDVNIGTRYILPALPFALIVTSRLWAFEGLGWGFLAKIRDGLLVMAAIEAVAVGPYFISYINFAFGGPSNGVKLLKDSDFDWGNGLIALRDWMHDHDVKRITLVSFGYIDPAIYKINYQLASVKPPMPYVAIDSYFLQGLVARMVVAPHHREPVAILYNEELLRKTPVAVAGDTIFIYNATDVLGAALEYRAMNPSSQH